MCTSTQKEMINRYLAVFKNLIAPNLQPTVVLQPSIYPFSNGVLLVIHFSQSGSGNIEYMGSSDDLDSAWAMAKLPTEMLKKATESNKPHRVLFDGDNVVEIKTFDKSCWSEKRASQIVEKIIRSVKAVIAENSPA